MFQTLSLLVLFIAAVACLPWLLRRWQQRQGAGRVGGGLSAKVLSTVAVGPTQRVVTVEVGDDTHKTCLVLGVTAQQIQCLHVLGTTSVAAPAAVPGVAPSFAGALAAVQTPAPATAASTTDKQG